MLSKNLIIGLSLMSIAGIIIFSNLSAPALVFYWRMLAVAIVFFGLTTFFSFSEKRFSTLKTGLVLGLSNGLICLLATRFELFHWIFQQLHIQTNLFNTARFSVLPLPLVAIAFLFWAIGHRVVWKDCVSSLVNQKVENP